MNSERTAQLQVALASYDLRELRVQKRYLQEQGTAIVCTCFCSGEKLLAMLPEPLRESYAPLVHETDETVFAIVKAADKLSAHIKCIEELKAGNAEFESAASQTRAALEQTDLPELQWFMEHCLPAFSKNLDELE